MKAITICQVPDELVAGVPLVEAAERTCRVCGCTDAHACNGGCYWVADDLCSACVSKTALAPSP